MNTEAYRYLTTSFPASVETMEKAVEAACGLVRAVLAGNDRPAA